MRFFWELRHTTLLTFWKGSTIIRKKNESGHLTNQQHETLKKRYLAQSTQWRHIKFSEAENFCRNLHFLLLTETDGNRKSHTSCRLVVVKMTVNDSERLQCAIISLFYVPVQWKRAVAEKTRVAPYHTGNVPSARKSPPYRAATQGCKSGVSSKRWKDYL